MEYNFFVVDSNVFVAFYNAADSYHDKAVSILRELESSTLVAHSYVVQEVATVLAYRFGLPVAKKFLNDITTAHNIIIAHADAKEDISYFLGLNKKVSFTDAALVGLVKRMNYSLVTFDRQMISLLKSA